MLTDNGNEVYSKKKKQKIQAISYKNKKGVAVIVWPWTLHDATAEYGENGAQYRRWNRG